MKKLLSYSVLVMLLGCMVFFGLKAHQKALLNEETTIELVTYHDATQQFSLQLESIAKGLLGDLYIDERRIALDKVREAQKQAKEAAVKYTMYCMVALLFVLLSYFVVSLRTFTLFGALAAMLTLIFGLITPILMVTIHKEVEYLGDIVLSFESKGVIGSVEKLFNSGDVLVAFVILLFSVVTPTLKIMALLFVSFFIKSDFAHRIVAFFKMIGKWSMVDVFVVAVFLVYLTANQGDVSRAEVQVGLYFFLAYVIVSMLVSLSADKMLKQKQSDLA